MATAVPSELHRSLAYVAPEQTGRLALPIDRRSDLYALGATFYEMLCGSPPFPSSDPAELVHAHLARPPVPPVRVDPSVPEELSDIVVKLLQKMPEERYQEAAELCRDLDRARRRWQASPERVQSERERDASGAVLPARERLHGRDQELAALLAAHGRAEAGASELILVTGAAGVGKSALVRELDRRALVHGRFLAGNCDRLSGDKPYGPFTEAFGRLLHELRAEEPSVLAGWRDRIESGLGASAATLTGIVPGLDALIPNPRPLPGLGPAEAKRRFHDAARAFVRILGAGFRPLVLLLDDLHRADAATLELLEVLATDPESEYLLLVASYRDEEVDPDHPLRRTVDAISAGSRSFHRIELEPLGLDALASLSRDLLRCDEDAARELAEVLERKTGGNALFVGRFLSFLVESGHLSYDPAGDVWRWSTARIERLGGTDNVLDLMVGIIEQLPARPRRLLEVAACFAHQIEVPILARAMGEPIDAVRADLWIMRDRRFLVPEGPGDPDRALVYRFVHDRVQQAAYSLVADDERSRIHLRLGNELLASLTGCDLEERLFDLVDQLNLGAEVIPESRRLELAELELRAGHKARDASAYGAALEYLEKGIGLLPEGASTDQGLERELRFHLHSAAAECAYLCGESAAGDRHADIALASARDRFEKAHVYSARIVGSTTRGEHDAAIQYGREALVLFDVVLPETRFDGGDGSAREQELQESLAAEFAAVRQRLGNRAPTELLDLEVTKDPAILAAAELLANVLSAAFVADRTLFAFVTARLVRLSLEHGNSVHSAFAYGNYAMLRVAAEQAYGEAHAFGRLSVELARRFGDPVQECRAIHVFCCFVNHWRAPLSSSLALLRDGVARGLEAGELQFTVYAQSTLVLSAYYLGIELRQVLSELATTMPLARKTHTKEGLHYQRSYRQAIRCLQGLTRDMGCFDDDDFSEQEHLESGGENPVALSLYYVLRLQICYLFGDLDEALATVRAAAPVMPAIAPLFPISEHTYYTALTHAATIRDPEAASEEPKAAALEAIQPHREQLARWAQGCPESFRAKHLLVEAEVARVEMRSDEAADAYDRACETAGQAGMLIDVALANELASRFWRARGRRRIAALYLRAAIDAYARWGALAKVTELEAEHPEEEGTLSPRGSMALLMDLEWKALDLLGLLKASENISGEVVFARLVEKLLAVCFESAGAARGALVVDQDGVLVLRAIGSTSEPVAHLETPLADYRGLPRALIEQVWRTDELIVISDAARERQPSDPQLAAGSTRSVLVMPIRRQARPIGVLYLENPWASGVFTPGRVELLRLLSSQIAISLENSFLFEKLRVEVDERRRAEKSIRFLAESSLTLAESLDYDLTLARIAELAVPLVADGCALDIVGEDNRLRRVAPPPDPADPATRSRGRLTDEALRTGAPQLVTDWREDPSSPGTAMAVPLSARGNTLGVITYRWLRRATTSELILAEELARRAAVSLENARLYQQAQQSIRVRDEFLSIASHELSTPLASMQLAAQGLASTLAASPEAASKAAEIVTRQTRRLATLTEELLSVSRIQEDRLELRLEEVDLVALVREVLDRFVFQVEQASCQVTFTAESPAVGWWDRNRLDQVVTNLLTNAIKFGAGAPIEVEITRVGERSRLTVTDHGIGIEADRLPHIFERFERAVESSRYGGLGLGLYIAERIVRALRGSIEASSEPGRGSHFVVELPRGRSRSGAAAEEGS
jgi:predicted ATPase/signal transduction histidine kinase